MKTTEAEVRNATGDELNRLVHLHCLGDDLSCFNPDGSERVERIVDAIAGQLWVSGTIDEYISHVWMFASAECKLPDKTFTETDGINSLAIYIWNNRHGKPYESYLKSHVQNWRAKPDDHARDMNLAEKLWCEEIEQISKTGDTYFVDSTDPHDGLDVCSNSLGVAICRAAVILAIRENNNAS